MISGARTDRAAKARRSFEARFSDPGERAAYFHKLAADGVAGRRTKRRARAHAVVEISAERLAFATAGRILIDAFERLGAKPQLKVRDVGGVTDDLCSPGGVPDAESHDTR